MKISIKTNNTEMTFDLRQEEVESLVWSAFQYASGSQPCQEPPDPEERYGGNPEDMGYQEYAKDLGDAEYADGVAAEEEPQAQEAGGYPGQAEELVGGEETEEGSMSQETGGYAGQTEGPIDGTGQWSQPYTVGGEPGMGQEGQEGQESYGPQMPAPWVPQELNPRRYKGFLIVKCGSCGKLKAFCAKTPIDTYICSCGGTTPIQNLVSATAACKCGKLWRYRTNADDQAIEVRCIECGNPIDLVWNMRRGEYVTIGA